MYCWMCHLIHRRPRSHLSLRSTKETILSREINLDQSNTFPTYHDIKASKIYGEASYQVRTRKSSSPVESILS
jgi:hypothetical protein